MATTDQEIANEVAAIARHLKQLVALEVAQAVFQSTGKLPEDHRERGPRPPGPRGND